MIYKDSFYPMKLKKLKCELEKILQNIAEARSYDERISLQIERNKKLMLIRYYEISQQKATKYPTP